MPESQEETELFLDLMGIWLKQHSDDIFQEPAVHGGEVEDLVDVQSASKGVKDVEDSVLVGR